MSSITYITGTRGVGKTLMIKAVAQLMPNAIGVIAEKCYDLYGDVAGYDTLLVPHGTRMPLCRRENSEKFSLRHGGFWFDPNVFEEVQKYVLKNLRCETPVIIDEIGSLEIKHHLGFYPLLEKLMQYDDLNLILTIRG